MGITHKSFTLMELIVAVGIIGLIIPAIFGIFFAIIRQQLVLVSYQEMKYQGDSVQRNIKNVLQNSAADITDNTYLATDMCPLTTTPTPTYFPNLYINDRDGNHVKLYQEGISPNRIASDSASKTYYLTTKDVVVTQLGFTCYRINEFTPAIVSAKFTVQKSTVFSDISLPYSFNVRLRNY